MTRLLPISLLACLLAGAAAPEAVPGPRAAPPGLPRLSTVDSLLAAGAVEAAAKLAREGLAAEAVVAAGAWQWRERLAAALERLGRAEEAVEQLEVALQEAPGAPSLHSALGRVLMALGRRGRALHELGEASALAPGDWRLALDHGLALRGFGLRPQALDKLRLAERLCGGCPPAARALADLHLEAGEFEAALPFLRSLQQAQPSPWSRQALALALLRTGGPAEARDLLAPSWPDSLADRERILLLEADRALGDGRRALAAAEGPELAGASDRFWGLAGLLLLETGQPAGALAALDRALVLAPGDSVHQTNRVVALTRLGRHEEARRLWERLQPPPAPADPPGEGRK